MLTRIKQPVLYIFLKRAEAYIEQSNKSENLLCWSNIYFKDLKIILLKLIEQINKKRHKLHDRNK